jgi:hypothetical protein
MRINCKSWGAGQAEADEVRHSRQPLYPRGTLQQFGQRLF